MPGDRSALPESIPETGFVLISVGLDEDGIAMAYKFDGLSPESAIGYLTTVTDLMRDDVRFAWHAARQEAYDDADDDFDEDEE